MIKVSFFFSVYRGCFQNNFEKENIGKYNFLKNDDEKDCEKQ